MLRQARHERGGVVHRLQCHPDTPAGAVSAVEIEWCADDDTEVLLIFTVTGADGLVASEPVSPARADGLWRTTCFEMFWRAEGADGYVEVNLSPSGRWAVYEFDGYRSGGRDQVMAIDPHIEVDRDGDRFVVTADVDFSTFPGGGATIGLSAVIEETDGTKSYWALAHPPGAPDFHHDTCFALELPALGRP